MSLGRVQEKVALVTGAGSGIGRATAALLASEGATVFVADLNEQAVQAVTAEIMSRRGKATPLRLDVADEATWQQATEHIRAAHQRLDIVVNNAGVSFAKPVTDTSLDEWRQVLSVNLDGVFLGTKYGIRAMQPGGGG